MVTQTFIPAGLARVDSGTERQVTPRVNVANFGDGYSQRSGDGIHTMETKSTVSFTNINTVEKNAIETFFILHGGWKHFKWTFPGDPNEKKWIAKSWTVKRVAYDIWAMTAEFERVFDLD